MSEGFCDQNFSSLHLVQRDESPLDSNANHLDIEQKEQPILDMIIAEQ